MCGAWDRRDAVGFLLVQEKERVHQRESGSPAPALHKRGLSFPFCRFHFNFFILAVVDRLLVREYPLCYDRCPRIFDRTPSWEAGGLALASSGEGARLAVMRTRFLVALATLLLLLPLTAQVTVELEFEKDVFLADETMIASVRITNFTGRALNLGRDNHWLMFSVEARDGFLVDQDGTPSVKGAFEIPNASRGTRRVNIAPYYRMRDPGSYQVVATVFLEEIQEVVKSAPVKVIIIRATTLWQKQFGVATGTERGLQVRKYSLIRALDDNQLMLYVRVASQDESEVYGVFRVGNLVSFGSPEAQIDRYSRLHLLQQYDARAFRYLVVTPDGALMIRQRYDYTRSRPKLGPIEDNLVGVVGGIRVPMDTDLPPSLKQLQEVNGASVPSAATESLGKTGGE